MMMMMEDGLSYRSVLMYLRRAVACDGGLVTAIQSSSVTGCLSKSHNPLLTFLSTSISEWKFWCLADCSTVVEKTLRPHVKLKTFNFTKKRYIK